MNHVTLLSFRGAGIELPLGSSYWHRFRFRKDSAPEGNDLLVTFLMLSYISRWWFEIFVYFHPYVGKDSHFDEHIVQRGGNHQLVMLSYICHTCDFFVVFSPTKKPTSSPVMQPGNFLCCACTVHHGFDGATE